MEMPPKKPKLPDAVLADLSAWIKMGAPDPRTESTGEVKRADKSWWSLQPLAKEFKHAEIDGFIDAKLAEQKLSRNDPAKPQALIRRLSYDLTGLPPTQAEVDAFVAAHQADTRKATEALVDRLLASPTSRTSILFGRLAGSTLFGALETLVFVLVLSVLFLLSLSMG